MIVLSTMGPRGVGVGAAERVGGSLSDATCQGNDKLMCTQEVIQRNRVKKGDIITDLQAGRPVGRRLQQVNVSNKWCAIKRKRRIF